jgi:hypothetical protein
VTDGSETMRLSSHPSGFTAAGSSILRAQTVVGLREIQAFRV